jgi:hypothetical protein
MAVGREVRARQDHGDRARAGGERGEFLAKGLQVGLGPLQPCDGRLGEEAARLAVYDHAVVDLPPLDHVAHDLHPVEEGQAGIADVQVHAGGRQLQVAVHEAGGGRLDVVAAHRGVDQHADPGAVEARILERQLRRHGRRVARPGLLVPEAPLVDSGQRLEQVRPEPEAFHRLGELGLDLGGGHAVRGVDVPHAHDGQVLELHAPPDPAVGSRRPVEQARAAVSPALPAPERSVC